MTAAAQSASSLDGYNGNFADINVNDGVRVTGLLSEDGDGNRIRVRNYLLHTPPYGDDVVRWVTVTGFDLLQSVDQATWTSVYGDLGSGFTMLLDPLEDFYYLNVASLTLSRDLALGYHPFYVQSVPDETAWFAFWAAQGVTAGAASGTWEAWMWQIINGDQPIFYLKVSAGPSYMLVDGLGRDFFGSDDYLRVNGGYLLGDYTFTGTLTDNLGATSSLPVDITFTGPLAVTGVDLLQSVDTTTWTGVSGDLAGGFTMPLDPAEDFYYLTAANLVANNELAVGYYPFYVTTTPPGWLAYWNAVGVNAGASPGSWQAWMYQIITGSQPIFYLKVSSGPSYKLVDGLGRDYFGSDDYLKVNGNYLLGAYTFTGTLTDVLGTTQSLPVNITFTMIQRQLTVVPSGTGTGTVTSVPAGIDCGATCSSGFENGTVVTLTAAAAAGSTFTGWTGDLSGSSTPQSLTMDSAKTVTATFTLDEYSLSISVVGNGSVAKNPDQTTYHYGDVVTLTATADTGWNFFGWSGDLTANTNPVTVTIDGSKTITATFAQNEYSLIVNIVGGGTVSLIRTRPAITTAT